MLRFVFLWGMAATVCSGAAYACSVEIFSIEAGVRESDRVVVGVVDSVSWDEVDLGGDEVFLVPREAIFRIERVLKGDPEPSEFRLSFYPAEDYLTCSELVQGYAPGIRMVLMLGDRVEPETYRAPSIPPWRLHLPSDDSYSDTELYQYVEGFATRGVAPIAIRFDGSMEQLVGQPLDVAVVVSNQMSTRLAISLNGSEPVANELHLWLSIGGVSIRGDDLPESFELDAGESRTISLGEHFDVVSQGHHWIAGVLWLPGGTSNPPIQDVIYRDPLQGPFSGIWPYQALETTLVHVHTWGRIKEAVTHGGER